MESSTVNPEQSRPAAGNIALGARTEPSQQNNRGAVLAKMLFVGDTVVALLAALATFAIFQDRLSVAPFYIAAAALIWPLTAFSIGLYRTDHLASWASAVSEVPRSMAAILAITWPLFGLGALLGVSSPVANTFTTVALIVVLGGLSRTVIRAVLHRRRDLRQRTVILGSGLVAGQIVEKIRNNNQFGLDPVGIIDEDVHVVGTPDLPRLGGFGDLRRVIEAQDIDRVIIAFSRVSHEELLAAIRYCRDFGIPVDVVPRLFEFLDGVRALDQIGGMPLLSIGAPVLGSAMIATKRILDVVGSAALLAAASPVMLVAALTIKLNSKGPVFFTQARAGRGNQSFRLIKFRSMYVDAEQRKRDFDELNEANDGVMFKIREDPRVTPVGRFIRRFSIDELPQLFNVLKGEMSLVGPRPLIFEEAEALDEYWHQRRLELRPGITGPWQVYGRSQSPFQEMVRFDYQYVVGWSLARDLELLLATLPAVLSGRGAY